MMFEISHYNFKLIILLNQVALKIYISFHKNIASITNLV